MGVRSSSILAILFFWQNLVFRLFQSNILFIVHEILKGFFSPNLFVQFFGGVIATLGQDERPVGQAIVGFINTLSSPAFQPSGRPTSYGEMLIVQPVFKSFWSKLALNIIQDGWIEDGRSQDGQNPYFGFGNQFFLPKHFFTKFFSGPTIIWTHKFSVSVAQFLLNKTRPSSVYNLISTKLNGRRPENCKWKTKKSKWNMAKKSK